MVFLKNQKKNNCMITETTIYYDKIKKGINLLGEYYIPWEMF